MITWNIYIQKWYTQEEYFLTVSTNPLLKFSRIQQRKLQQPKPKHLQFESPSVIPFSQSLKTQNSSDEIDLGQLFQLIGRVFNAMFKFFLRIFIYLKKNIFILLGLVILGFGVGYALSKIVSKKLKTEVKSRPSRSATGKEERHESLC